MLQSALDNRAEHPERWDELTDRGPSVTGREIIHRYQSEYGAAYARTVGKDLDLLSRSDLAQIPVGKLKSGDIVTHIKQRVDGVKKADGTYKVAPVSPATAANDLVGLQTIFDAAWASFNIPVPREELEKARIECRKRRLVAKAKERDRVPTEEELERICGHFAESTRAKIPMADIVRFAVYSARVNVG